jgi:hypothetical protein
MLENFRVLTLRVKDENFVNVRSAGILFDLFDLCASVVRFFGIK